MPLCLEIGSGFGEWAIEAARKDAGKANWVGLELRHDRVSASFTKMFLQGSSNVCFIQCDAKYVLQHLVAKQSVAVIRINHPEPPERTGSSTCGAVAEENSLLVRSFFSAAMHVLSPGAPLVIITDNLEYGKSLLSTISETGFKGSENVSVEIARVGSIRLEEVSPELSGESVDESTYFDRLWKAGAKKRRFKILAFA